MLAVPGLFDSGLSAVLDVLATANVLRGDVATSVPPFDVTVGGTEASVRTGHGLRLATTPLAELGTSPTCWSCQRSDATSSRAADRGPRAEPSRTGPRHGSAHGWQRPGGGVHRDILPGRGGRARRPAGHHQLVARPAFRRRYTAVRLDESRTLTRDGRVTTAGAAFAHIDLALSIVAQESPALAELVARYLLIGDRPSQAIFAVPSHLAATDPTMTAFERWVRDHVAEPLQISRVAAAIGVSERTLQRTTAAALGMSPIDFVHEIRLDEATFLLRTTNQTVDAIAAAVGYQNTSTLRALVRRRRGTTLSALRHVRPSH